ncbi:transmembrane protease serine 9 [Monomorium pharaonis]|uniref:transmembrane protease serine 9 n=1 Tax=Monomorium pharaonis TaxID=307658 RepID=UPI001746D42C|nr:transmembrane protease serine 9 [Monomorium pharaonis]
MLVRCLLATVLVFQACLAVPFGLKPRITDGEDATPGEFPYQVSVRWGIPPLIPFSHSCGGSIINESFVLTAGHCVLRFGKLKVFAGKHYLFEDEDTQQEVDVAKAYVHEKYPGGVAPYDIALLKLKTPLVFNERVSAVKLPEQDEVRTGNTVLSGWGSVSKELLPVLPKVLQKVRIPLLDNKACQEKFPKEANPPKIYDSQICTDVVEEISACSGDSGGPLVQFEDNVPTQVGIVSWGVYPCGVNRMPSVYTRVASYVDWIKLTIWLSTLENFNIPTMSLRCFLATVLVFQVCLAVSFGLKPRITDGEDAIPGEFPYQVSVQWGVPPFTPFSHSCGGSIINKNFVLTAGHCIMNYGSLKVFAGKYYLNKKENTEQVVDVATAYVHEKYSGDVGPYDIAILELKTPLVFNKRVSAVKLPKQCEVRTGNAVLSGWGSISKKSRPLLPEVLQKVTIPLLDNKSCQKKFSKDSDPAKIYNSQICTDAIGEISACSGDSGGPLVQFENNVPIQVGIVSWGIYPCGVNHMPSVYTRVASYIDWIKFIIS